MRNQRGKGPENPGRLLKRLMGMLMKHYGVAIIIVAICIIINVLANVQGTMFMQRLIDDYITPLLKSETKNYTPLLHAIGRVACFYGIGIIASYSYNRIMVNVTQGMLKTFRDSMFTKMEQLPIKYFDTHAHGDIMSMYTNDTDTLRQMISQSMPQLFNSAITIISTTVCMFMLNIPLTALTFFMVGIMLVLTRKIGGLSAKHFIAQQKDIGTVNGYIEEMMQGQRVVKVFCHEEESKEAFDKLNDALCESSYKANNYSNILGPINAQLGNISYVLCAIVGGVLAIGNVGGFTLGGLASFLTFNKNFNMPINQISMQINAIVMALAGAERIFNLLDEEPEVDEGYVELVNAKRENGQLVPSEKRTGLWAWAHKHTNGDPTTYVELKGDVVFDDVDFGYTDDKIVLHNVSMFAQPGQKLAFVGSTGAGKTTITNLINRFYDIQDGKIRYDGININKIKKADLRRSLGIVLQDTHLFSMSVRENIRYGRLDATDEEVEAAAKLANADGFIRRLPQGYDTPLTDNGMIGNRTGQFLKLSLKLRSFYTKHFDRFFSLCGSCITQFCCCKSCLNLSFSNFLRSLNRCRSQSITESVTHNSQIGTNLVQSGKLLVKTTDNCYRHNKVCQIHCV